MDLLRVARSLFEDDSRPFAVKLWDGRLLPPSAGQAANGCVVLERPQAVNAFLPPASEVGLAQAFIEGDLEIEGDTLDVLTAAAHWRGPKPSLAFVLPWAQAFARTSPHRTGRLAAGLKGKAHSRWRDAEAVRRHYDLSNALYRLFLDPTLTYSCGYFPTGEETLEQAQVEKLDLVCRKLALRPEDRLLDVGCGWGGLIVHAAERYRARGLGITLSENQLDEARRRLDALPSGARWEARLTDYRGLEDAPAFDKVASVGMMEHVGHAHLEAYFTKVFRVLRPGGLFLNHAIAALPGPAPTLPWVSRRRGGFIERYIFPDSELIPLPEVLRIAERAGFEVRDVESLREHYTRTLSHWLTRLEQRFPLAVSQVGRERARAFRLYLGTSAVAFRTGRISVFQTLLAKRTEAGQALGVPGSRAAWYVEPPLRSEPVTSDAVYQQGA
jgi:cyclopropane-fatty-acyl-phospholipid synthase